MLGTDKVASKDIEDTREQGGGRDKRQLINVHKNRRIMILKLGGSTWRQIMGKFVQENYGKVLLKVQGSKRGAEL